MIGRSVRGLLGRRLGTIVAVAVALILGLSACGGSAPKTSTGPSPSPELTGAAETPATATDETDTALTPDDEPTDAQQPAASSECDDGGSPMPADPPNGAERQEETTGDLDGDGRDDRIITWAITLGDDRTIFHLRIATAAGYVAEVELDEASPMRPVGPLGTADIGGEREVAFIIERGGASTYGVSLWGLHEFDDDPCRLGRVTVADHTAPNSFAVGGTIGSGSGLACDDADGDGTNELLVRRTTAASDDTYAYTQDAYTWPGAGALRHVETTEDEFHQEDDRDRMDALLGLQCPGVEQP